MMRIHKEGRVSLLIVALVIVAVNYLLIRLTREPLVVYPVSALSVLLYLFVMYFFRVPNRPAINDERAVVAPCDGKIVVIEKCSGNEYFEGECLQISIFMSPLDVHMNWFPVSGKVLDAEYQKGSHLVAWAPKASTDNERATVVLENPQGRRVVVRQIAGAVARRVVCYAQKDAWAQQNDALGFIKFGSRVDLFLPPDVTVNVKLNQKVIGSQTLIARFPI
ncbi:MAG TPA: phosphatidylserine decarboxylase family protein [Prolixibacteraceae bacterium]|nr:phosphatidylserine decarboxylase family protein [Prolixibacteraceae bacterium]